MSKSSNDCGMVIVERRFRRPSQKFSGNRGGRESVADVDIPMEALFRGLLGFASHQRFYSIRFGVQLCFTEHRNVGLTRHFSRAKK